MNTVNETEARTEGFFQRILDEERDPKLHQVAGFGVWFCRQAAASSPAEDVSC